MARKNRGPKGPLSPYDPKHKANRAMAPNDKKASDYLMMTPEEVAQIYKLSDMLMRGSPSFLSGSFEPQRRDTLTPLREPIAKWISTIPHDTSFDEIIGNESARTALVEALFDPIDHRDLYTAYDMSPPKGVLLYGPPGCGKTMFAKAAAATLAKRFGKSAEVLNISAQALQSPYVGVTEERIRAIFRYAAAYHKHHGFPLVVFMDEADAFLPDRTGKHRRVHPWEESNVAEMLVALDGLESCGAFTILATNRPHAIDEALLRDGRIGRKIKVERPTREAFTHIVTEALRQIPRAAPARDLAHHAAEEFFSPFRNLAKVEMLNTQDGTKHIAHFNLEHIVSGALAVAVVTRAKSIAFRRDKASAEFSGIGFPDIAAAVAELYEENQNFDHTYAREEFLTHAVETLELRLAPKGTLQ